MKPAMTKSTPDEIEFARLQALFVEGGEFSPQEHIFFRDKLLEQWEQSKVALELAKDFEMSHRKAIVLFAFDPEKNSGTENVELANGYKLKSVKKLNYNVDQANVNAALDKIEAFGEKGKVIAERLIKWKADLSLSEYKTLSEEYKAIIDEVITISEGSPTLEIVKPKDKKV